MVSRMDTSGTIIHHGVQHEQLNPKSEVERNSAFDSALEGVFNDMLHDIFPNGDQHRQIECRFFVTMSHMDNQNAYLWLVSGSELNGASVDTQHDYVVLTDPKTRPFFRFNPGFQLNAVTKVYFRLACFKFHSISLRKICDMMSCSKRSRRSQLTNQTRLGILLCRFDRGGQSGKYGQLVHVVTLSHLGNQIPNLMAGSVAKSYDESLDTQHNRMVPSGPKMKSCSSFGPKFWA